MRLLKKRVSSSDKLRNDMVVMLKDAKECIVAMDKKAKSDRNKGYGKMVTAQRWRRNQYTFLIKRLEVLLNGNS